MLLPPAAQDNAWCRLQLLLSKTQAVSSSCSTPTMLLLPAALNNMVPLPGRLLVWQREFSTRPLLPAELPSLLLVLDVGVHHPAQGVQHQTCIIKTLHSSKPEMLAKKIQTPLFNQNYGRAASLINFALGDTFVSKLLQIKWTNPSREFSREIFLSLVLTRKDWSWFVKS